MITSGETRFLPVERTFTSNEVQGIRAESLRHLFWSSSRVQSDDHAVKNTGTLFEAAVEAVVERIAH